MTLLYDIAYFFAAIFAAPFLALKSYRTGKYRTDWPARFGRIRNAQPLALEDYQALKHKGQEPLCLMLHCVSVGELNSTRLLVDRLLATEPRLNLVITTTTDTGTNRSRELYSRPEYSSRVRTCRYPLDFSFAVNAFLRQVQPDAVALVELEAWPNFTAIARRRGIPTCIINGRLTMRSFKRYNAVRVVTRSMLRRMEFITAQTPTIAQRFQALGARDQTLTVLPTLKYDAADFTEHSDEARALAAATGVSQEHLLLVGGSVAPGEDTALLECYETLRHQFPNLRLALAPRRPENNAVARRAIERAGLHVVARSAHPDGATRLPLTTGEVLLLDTLGELKHLYRLAFMVFVGRSLTPMGGSDMIEAAALAKPSCFGPHTDNFAQAVELLTGNNAAVIVPTPAALTLLTAYFLNHPQQAEAMGRRARDVVWQQRGSTDKTVEMLLNMLRAKTGATCVVAAPLAQSA